MPLNYKNRVLLAKRETTYGTDSIPIGANAILVSNMSITPIEMDLADRDLVRPYFGRSEQIPTASRVMCEFEVEIQGSGTAGTAPGYGELLRACGFSETVSSGVSVTYAPVSTAFDSVTMYYNNDGVLHRLTGARGTFTLSKKVKEIPKFKFSFTAVYNGPTDTAMITPNFSSFRTPTAVNNVNTTGFSLHSFSGVLSELEIDIANTIVHRTLVGGSESVLLTDRQTQGKITIEATTVAQKDWWTLARNATLGNLDITHGTVAGSRVAVNSSQVQIVKPTYSEMDNVTMLSADLNFIPSSAGNNEISIVVS
jgi:hypothetical protein